MAFSSKEDVASWLLLVMEDLAGDQVILVEEQRVEGLHRGYVVLTTTCLIIVQTQADAVPRVRVYHPKHASIEARIQGESSMLRIRDAQGGVVEVTRLHPLSAQRVEDAVRLMRVGRLDDQSPVPERIAFEGVYPIEYYEAILGPNRQRVIQCLDFGDHRFSLDIVTKESRGYFLVHHYVQAPSGFRELEPCCRPLRSSQARLHREHRPYQVHLIPATNLHPAVFLARHGIGTRIAESIRERYVRQQRHTGLQAVLAALKAAGIRSDDVYGYRVLQGEYTRLKVGGKTFIFDATGAPVTLRPLYPETTP